MAESGKIHSEEQQTLATWVQFSFTPEEHEKVFQFMLEKFKHSPCSMLSAQVWDSLYDEYERLIVRWVLLKIWTSEIEVQIFLFKKLTTLRSRKSTELYASKWEGLY